MAFEKDINQTRLLLINMGLNEYQAAALAHLIFLGETKATTLSKTSKVPSARIYGVLDQLAKMGLVTIRPGRPVLYTPRPLEDIASSLVTFSMSELKEKLRILEDYAKDFVETSKKIYLKGKKGAPKVPLLRIVSVGEVSLDETKKLYDAAEKEIQILSRAMQYFPEVADKLREAVARGVSLKIILMKPDMLEPEDRKKQAEMLEKVNGMLGDGVEIRFTDEIPIRGCIVDPKIGGKALFLVEDPGVPFFLREAAITSHQSVVRGLALMYSLLWEHKTTKR
ncbi:MAG: TrmB family transcriptional regulator [Candidatus Bathyarchaeaceae archaeon]